MPDADGTRGRPAQRSRAVREVVLGCLYAHYTTNKDPDAVFADHVARFPPARSDTDRARRLFLNTLEQGEIIDRAIRRTADNWDFSRIGLTEKNIMRLAVAEFWTCPETPPKVVIDEAVELAKAYAGEGSAEFVNAILDKIWKAGPESFLEADEIEDEAK